jgi:hypothetical protein
MAYNYRSNASSTDWNVAGDWSLGAVPVAADTVALFDGTAVINQNLPAAAAGVNYAGFEVGPEFRGGIGDSSNRLFLGTVVADVRFNGAKCQEAWLAVDAGDACNINVINTSMQPYALNLYSGTWTNIRVLGGYRVLVSAGVTSTTIYLGAPQCKTVIAAGATLTNLDVASGQADLSAALTTIRVAGGVLNLIAQSAITHTTLDIWGPGVVNFWSEGGTITNAYVRRGATLNCNGGRGKARTITNLYRYAGGTIDLRGIGSTVTITDDKNYGGVIQYGAVP